MSDSEALYQAALQEGSDSQRMAFERLWRYLFAVARRMLADVPGGEDMAADCTQLALIKIHRRMQECREPARFLSWSAQIVRRTVIDELRRPDQARRAEMPPEDRHPVVGPDLLSGIEDLPTLVREVLQSAPLSDRSRRVVVGRYFEERTDEYLARVESETAGREVLPSQIQVTRSKNLAKLRGDQSLIDRLQDLLSQG